MYICVCGIALMYILIHSLSLWRRLQCAMYGGGCKLWCFYIDNHSYDITRFRKKCDPQYTDGIWGLGPQHLILKDFRRRVPPG